MPEDQHNIVYEKDIINAPYILLRATTDKDVKEDGSAKIKCGAAMRLARHKVLQAEKRVEAKLGAFEALLKQK